MDFVPILWAYSDFVDYVLILIIILSYSHPPTVKCSPGLVLDLFFLGSHQKGVYDISYDWGWGMESFSLLVFFTRSRMSMPFSPLRITTSLAPVVGRVCNVTVTQKVEGHFDPH